MSSTTSATSATCTGNIWVLPTQDAACALPATGNNSKILDGCCGVADVRKYNDDCGLYCLAQGQNISRLLNCIEDNGATPGEFFCNANMSATATASAPSSTHSDDGDDSDPSATTTDDAASPTNSDNAAVHVTLPVSKTGLGVLAMLFCSALMGVMA